MLPRMSVEVVMYSRPGGWISWVYDDLGKWSCGGENIRIKHTVCCPKQGAYIVYSLHLGC